MYTESQKQSTKKLLELNEFSIKEYKNRTFKKGGVYFNIQETNTEILKIPFQEHEIPIG